MLSSLMQQSSLFTLAFKVLIIQIENRIVLVQSARLLFIQKSLNRKQLEILSLFI